MGFFDKLSRKIRQHMSGALGHGKEVPDFRQRLIQKEYAWLRERYTIPCEWEEAESIGDAMNGKGLALRQFNDYKAKVEKMSDIAVFYEYSFEKVLRIRDDLYIFHNKNRLWLYDKETVRPITVLQAKRLESDLCYKEELYQARQDFQRGGTPLETAYAKRGFDPQGYRISSAVDRFIADR